MMEMDHFMGLNVVALLLICVYLTESVRRSRDLGLGALNKDNPFCLVAPDHVNSGKELSSGGAEIVLWYQGYFLLVRRHRQGCSRVPSRTTSIQLLSMEMHSVRLLEMRIEGVKTRVKIQLWRVESTS
jgi:hypothetical protein